MAECLCIPLSNEPKFSLGHLNATPNALGQLTHDDMIVGLNRHIMCDWGDLDTHDLVVNKRAFEQGGRLFSAYESAQRVRFYIITEADRSYTTILMPEDY